LSGNIHSPRQNRVTPFGEFIAHSSKGMFMGNRGDLHAPDGSLGPKRWRHKAWITCALESGSGRVTFDQPGKYYPLFFHDEAVALAAGHRPCGHCRPEALERFKHAWRLAYGLGASHRLSVKEIDAELHRHRTAQMASAAPEVTALPDGAFIALKSPTHTAGLIWRGELHVWHPDGYRSAKPLTDLQCLLTPKPIIQVLSSGYTPAVTVKP
tara:strand:- start:1837 stop:2469 length:633 start_codon:yes stop_codon:yes gene_type:complete